MPKSASLGSNLVDDLLPVVGELRAELYNAFGVRQFEVYLVRRRWSGATRGEGTVTVVSEEALSPRPMVKLKERGGNQLAPGGLDEADDLVLKEVDLRYTEGDLTGQPVLENEEWLYRLDDANGQSIASRWFVLSGTPQADREKNLGWVVRLHEVEVRG